MDAKTQTGPAAIRAVHAAEWSGGPLRGRRADHRTLRVDGDLDVKGDIRLTNADYAEDFDMADAVTVEPGTVMVLNDIGELAESAQAYDKRVAGVVSGAGALQGRIVLDRRDTVSDPTADRAARQGVLQGGRAIQAIAVGDLLTTSPTPGHAMATHDAARAFGAVIGKALKPLPSGQGLIPILIALQ